MQGRRGRPAGPRWRVLAGSTFPDPRSEVTALLGHELRTPLTTIHGGLVLLDDHGDRLSARDRHEVMDAVRHETERLIRLVDDLVTVAGPPDLGPVVQPMLLQRELPVVLADPDVKGHNAITATLDADAPPVSGDRDALRQVLRGLIAALGKDDPPSGRIAILVFAAPHDRAVVRLSRSDGRPVRILRPGARLSLAASRVLMDAMGGDFRVRRGPRGRLELEVGLPGVATAADEG